MVNKKEIKVSILINSVLFFLTTTQAFGLKILKTIIVWQKRVKKMTARMSLRSRLKYNI